jgi:hypothetical protein
MLFSNFSCGGHFIQQFSLSLSESRTNKKMKEKREEKQTLTWHGIKLSNSIPWGRKDFEPRGFI